jgi:hypothetical protein
MFYINFQTNSIRVDVYQRKAQQKTSLKTLAFNTYKRQLNIFFLAKYIHSK